MHPYYLTNLFFFLMNPQPPRSTLFPYTTLFRSLRTPITLASDRNARKKRAVRGRSPRSASTAADRKSTRLNSSHVEISYAVFCLKKKNKKYKCHLLIEQHHK